jgi:hypothetical protein
MEKRVNELARRPTPAGSWRWPATWKFAINSMISIMQYGMYLMDDLTEFCPGNCLSQTMGVSAFSQRLVVRLLIAVVVSQLNSTAMRVLSAVTCNAMGHRAML